MAVEKLTRERRRQQTRDVLIAAATEVFAQRGFEGASLEEIAETAGFTRGAIYKHFADKEDLFFAVTDGMNELVIESFRALAPNAHTKEWDFSGLAEMWRASVDDFEDLFAIGKELIGLYLGRSSLGSAYGAAGSFLVLLVWVYYSAVIFFLGAELSQVWATAHGRGFAPKEGVELEERVSEKTVNPEDEPSRLLRAQPVRS